MGQYTRPDCHVVPFISVPMVFHGLSIYCQAVLRESCCNKNDHVVIHMLIFLVSYMLRASYLISRWLVA